MSAAHLHLLIVHLPVLGAIFAAALLVAGEARGRSPDGPSLRVTGWLVLLVSAVSGIVAYYSGPPAYEQLEAVLAPEKEWVEQHAVIGRAAFVGLVVAGALAVQALLQHLQEETPARWLRWTILGLVLVLCYVLAWAAHLGGLIRHEEIRPASPLFPPLAATPVLTVTGSS